MDYAQPHTQKTRNNTDTSTRPDAPSATEAMQAHYTEKLQDSRLRDLFSAQPDRGSTLTLEHDGVYVDYSKNRITSETLSIMQDLLAECDMRGAIDAMFSGVKINTTENRSVLHVALRNPSDSHVTVDGEDVMPVVKKVLQQMTNFARTIRDGSWTGYDGAAITDVVHIGIGGSEIGPHMADEALAQYADTSIRAHFVSNVDPADMQTTLAHLKPSSTLFVVVSKSFTTIETLTNAQAARTWLLDSAPDERAVARHFVAVSTNTDAVSEFGIDPANIFEMWDWVGGRYSLMSSVGLTLMVVIGPAHFGSMLDGAHSMDEHFRTAPFEQNIPITLALLSVLYNNYFGAETELVLPYSSQLGRFTTYLQQANMESNGKSVRVDGSPTQTATGPIVWGTPGTDAQHTFMQHVHQSGRLIPTDIILFKRPYVDSGDQHNLLLSNALAQAEALAFGTTDTELREGGVPEELVAHKRMPGNQPSTTLLLPKLTPYTFGQLIALYEHKIYAQGVLWGINSFDQWGVQLGKTMATTIAAEISSNTPGTHDSSTSTLVSKLTTE